MILDNGRNGQEAMSAGPIQVIPDDLPDIVDPARGGAARTEGILYFGIRSTIAIEYEPVPRSVVVISQDLAGVIDAKYIRPWSRDPRLVDRGEFAVAVDESVLDTLIDKREKV